VNRPSASDPADAACAPAPDLDLRARKKRATRDALARAAMLAALEHGLQYVRVEDIAARAGVSARTFNNYFASKEQAIVALPTEQTLRTVDLLRERPADEPLDVSLPHILIAPIAEYMDAPLAKAAVRMIVTEPALRGEFLRTIAVRDEMLSEVIAERTGTDPRADLFPSLLAAIVSTVSRVATTHWLAADNQRPLRALLAEALEMIAPLARGTPPPRRAPNDADSEFAGGRAQPTTKLSTSPSRPVDDHR
jgi:AcrR family transcriptional regulator